MSGTSVCRSTSIRLGFLVYCLLALVKVEAAEVPSDKVFTAERNRIAVMEQVAPSVVAVFGEESAGGGSGVLVSRDGYVITNFHVIQGAGAFLRCGLNDGKLYDAVVTGIDPTGDVAVIKMLGRDNFSAAKLGNSDDLSVGDWVFAMGNPFLLAADYHPTVTYGIVSGLHRYQYPSNTILEYTDCIQTDASINPGNSGGPLFNMRGELVGINGRASFEKRGRVNSGAAYAISINQIKKFLDPLRYGRIVDHATLGATVVANSQGVIIVSEIQQNSDAFVAGLRLDDEIVSFGSRPIRSVNQFKNILGIYPQGAKVPLVYRREGKKHEISVRLQGLHERSQLVSFVEGDSPKSPRREEQPQKPEKPAQPAPGKVPEKKNVKGQQKPSQTFPEQWKHLYVYRSGYANYHFNLEQRNACLAELRNLGSPDQWKGLWQISGVTGQKLPFEFKLGKTGAGLILEKDQFYQSFLEDEGWKDEPAGSGGLLAAWRHIQIMLTGGAEKFTECSYWGIEEWGEPSAVCDVVRCDLAATTSYWYFRRPDHLWVGIRFHLMEDATPCEMSWEQWGNFKERRFPAEITVKGSVNFRQHFKVKSLSVVEKPAESLPQEKSAPGKNPNREGTPSD